MQPWSKREERAQSMFKHTNIKIRAEGKRNLGAVIGTTNHRQNCMKEKIEQLITELRMLCKIA